ncbi:hypothetical protein [Jidongwangia harbinensis]|uniref:hypothetical protein n=1 Tax=Jidongwangia harbinensis TaxID=2878561 RepID=UPI001CD91E0C|nr:hypothetical protein [Jidongwangia harbinensis]MCA2218707.1 hypothetical protein [Jidongwangia harbinensis]
MRIQDLGTYARASGRFLVDEHGFDFTRRRYTRSDGLLRSVWFLPLNATPDRYLFEVVFDVGIPGISEFGARKQAYVVRANAPKTALAHPDYPKPPFVLTADDDGRPVAPMVDQVVRRLAGDFLLRYRTPAEFYEMVRDSAVRAADQGAHSDDDFGRLRLDPGNAVMRLELSAVYGAFLGRDDEVAETLALVRAYAPPNRVDYMIPVVEAGVEAARKARAEAPPA